jgi:hypothetical protein
MCVTRLRYYLCLMPYGDPDPGESEEGERISRTEERRKSYCMDAVLGVPCRLLGRLAEGRVLCALSSGPDK